MNVPSTYNGKNPLTINTYGVHDLDYQLGIGDTYLFTPNLVNSLRVSASRTNVVKLPDNYASWASFGANYSPIGGNVVDTTISGGLGFNVGTSASVPGASHNGPNPSLTEEVSWVKGSHQFMLGGNVYFQEMNYWSGLNAVGSMTFNGSSGTGLGMTDLLLGLASGFSQGTAYGFYNRQWYLSMYAQDTWKATRKLTVNYGVRWEPYLGQYNKYGQIHDVVPSLFAANYHSPVFTNAPAGVIFPGDPNYPCGKSFQCDDWHKFLPRVGIAYDPKGDGKMVIRAGYGMYEDRSHMLYPNQMSFGPPFGDNVSAFVTNLSNLWGPYGGVPGFSAPGQNPILALAAVAGIGRAAKDAPFPTGGGYIDFATQGSSRCTQTSGIWRLKSRSARGYLKPITWAIA